MRSLINAAARVSSVLVLGSALAGCGGSGSSPQPVTTVNPLGGKLQLAVGTANIFGDLGGAGAGSATGLNVVATFRQVKGQQTVGASETLVNTPSLAGPMTLPPAIAPSTYVDLYGATLVYGTTPAEVSASTISATAQPPAGTVNVAPSSFGVSNGVFSAGIEPFNTTVVGGAGELPAGEPVSYAPNFVPAYDPLTLGGGSDPNAFVPFGGPPAFDPNKTGRGTRDGLGEPATQFGVEEGLDVFQGVVPRTGTYSLSVVIPTQSKNLAVTTTATLKSTALLPAVAPPATVASDGNGGLTSIPIVLPAGVTEAFVQITDIGPTQSDDPNVVNPVSCNGSAAGSPPSPLTLPSPGTPTYYTIRVTASGTYALAPGLGPVAEPSATSPSLCTADQNTTFSLANVDGFTGQSDGDQFTVQVVGFDYPAFAASPILEIGNPAPVLTGANGQSDTTISSAAFFTQPIGSSGPQTLLVHRGARKLHRSARTLFRSAR